MAKKCDHEDTRLKCTECDAPICSACLVQCPVGFRCKKCVQPQKQDIKDAPWMARVKCFAASAFVGLVAGWMIPHMGIPYISCFICFFMGIYSGRWLVKFVDHHHLGSKTAPTIVYGVLLGMCFSPLILIPPMILTLLGFPFMGSGVTVSQSLLGVLSVLFDPVCFFAGILRPTVWGEF